VSRNMKFILYPLLDVIFSDEFVNRDARIIC
jgi:hypothetical protein